MRRVATASLVAAALACAADRAALAPAAPPGQGSVLRAPELARVRCLLVAPFENGTDAPLAAEAATSEVLGALDPARTRVFPVADLRALFKDTSLELPQGLSPSLALELAGIVGADAALWGSVEGRTREAAPELLVTIRLGLAGDRQLLFAETGLAIPGSGEKPETAVRRTALELVRPMLARLGDPGRKRCFDAERLRTVRRLAVSEEGGPRGTAPLLASRLSAPAVASAAPAPAAVREPRTPRQADWSKRLVEGERILVEDVAFSGRTAGFQRDAGLADLAAVLLARPDLGVRLEGFVDATTDHGADQKLSAAMAQAAGKRLVELGVSKAQLSWAGRGGESPVLPNFTARGRAANRRIEAVAAR